MVERIDKLRETLAQLHEQLDNHPELDAELRSELRSSADEIREALDGALPEDGATPLLPDSVLERLRAAIERFESSHPTLTSITGRVVDALAELGI